MDIKKYPEEPFASVLDEMGILLEEDRYQFFTTVAFFAEECNRISNNDHIEPMTELEGFFNWRAVGAEKYFKILFTYFHSEELLVNIDGFEELTREQYIESYGDDFRDEDCGCDDGESNQSN